MFTMSEFSHRVPCHWQWQGSEVGMSARAKPIVSTCLTYQAPKVGGKGGLGRTLHLPSVLDSSLLLIDQQYRVPSSYGCSIMGGVVRRSCGAMQLWLQLQLCVRVVYSGGSVRRKAEGTTRKKKIRKNLRHVLFPCMSGLGRRMHNATIA